MTEPEKDQPFEGFAVLELMGHRRIAGYVSQVEMFGAAMLRIDVPGSLDGEEPGFTQFYSAAALYAMTPTTQAIARAVAAGNRPAPIHRWELPALRAERGSTGGAGLPEGAGEFDPDAVLDDDDINDCDDDD